MSRPRNSIPKARPHSSGQARVTIEGKDYLLGTFGSPEADEAYRRIIAQWLAKEGPFALKDEAASVTINEVLAAYWLHAERYYGFDKDPQRGDAYNTRMTLSIVRGLYGSTFAKDFGPLDLRAVQGEMIRRGWCRNLVNREVGRVKRCLKWAVAEEMIPPAVWHALLASPGLRRGKTEAVESAPVKPVDAKHIDAVRLKLRPALAAMLDFMLLTGCRPNEVCQLRPIDIDRTNPKCWVFRPGRHKTEHHGHDRLVLIGPKAQEAVAPFLLRCPSEEFVFSPQREEERRNRERREARESPMTPTHEARRERSHRSTRERPPADRYTTVSFRRAIGRACSLAGVPVWGPNRLRHTRATELRPHGLDNVATILGHAKIETTQIYSEKNLAAAMELVAKVG